MIPLKRLPRVHRFAERAALALILVGLLAACSSTPKSELGDGHPKAGPLYYQYDLALEKGTRTEALGPFWRYERSNDRMQWGFHPVVSYSMDRKIPSYHVDLLYPFATYDRFGSEYRFQFLQLLSSSGGRDLEKHRLERLTLFPFYAHQRSDSPDLSYTAVFPFYGSMKNRFLWDRVDFAMFPVYSRTRNKGVTTENYLYPFFRRRYGEGVDGWRFWPLGGYETKPIATETNMWGEAETVPGYKKVFAFWPFFFHHRTALGTDNPKREIMSLPFFRIMRSPERDSTSVLWPFLTLTHDRADDYREVGAPWPLIVFAWGEGKTVRRIWPLFGQAEGRHLESDFYLWPIYHYDRTVSGSLRRRRARVLFFLYSDLREKNVETEKVRWRRDLWPLFQAGKDFDGSKHLQVLALLEPFFPTNQGVRRNYSPLWSLWRSEYDPEMGLKRQSLLWNLFHREAGPQRESVSFLFGLFQYHSSSETERWRLFYLPAFSIGKSAQTTD